MYFIHHVYSIKTRKLKEWSINYIFTINPMVFPLQFHSNEIIENHIFLSPFKCTTPISFKAYFSTPISNDKRAIIKSSHRLKLFKKKYFCGAILRWTPFITFFFFFWKNYLIRRIRIDCHFHIIYYILSTMSIILKLAKTVARTNYGQNGQIPQFLEIFSKKTLFRK